ncbi:MAG: hypothetical protein PF486_14845 [Prolixibacteraceae bacterium]|jgi:hypothetical protein|nr:hypothetical protein [Prolixibacteraceae bacterium]
MNQTKNKVLALLFTIIFISIASQSLGQIQFGLVVKSGLCKVNREDRNYSYDDGGYIILRDYYFDHGGYTYAMMYAIEGNIVEQIANSRFSFEQAVGIEIKTIKEDNSLYFNDGESHINSGNAISLYLPVKFKYRIGERFNMFIGGSNIFNFASDFSIKSNTYNIRGVVGFDFKLSDRYQLGVEYGRDITPYANFYNDTFRYRFNLFAVEVAMRLSKRNM